MHLRTYQNLAFILFFISSFGYGQSFVIPDSLKNKTYDELRDAFFKNVDTDKSKAELYFRAYFNKGKINSDSTRMTWAYFIKSELYKDSDPRQLTIWDSAIFYGKNIDKEHYPEMLYNRRGLAYGDQGDFKNQLKDYLTALKYSKRNNNIQYIYILKHNIGIAKRKLGKYIESKSLLNECLVFEKNKFLTSKTKWDTIGYLHTLTELVSTYRLNGQLDSARVLNSDGIILSRRGKLDFLFDLNDGILDYHDKKYHNAKMKIENILPRLHDYRKGFIETYNLIDAYLYLGKTYKVLGQREKAVSYFKKIDSISKGLNYYIPESRLAYIELVNHYKSINNYPNQLLYVDKLLRADSISTSNYKSINDKLLREYDTPKLLEEKQKLITALEQENKSISSQNIIISILLAISLFGVSYYYYRQRLFKKRFLKLLDKTASQDQKKDDSNNEPPGSTSINKETVNNLLDRLQKFEEKQGYLKTGLNAKDLAKSFGSNSSYLSKVVNTFKEKSFSSYINDLRISFVIDKLQEDTMFRKYTIKAIAQEIGFNNSEAFSKAFYKNTGIYPSYFIKEIEKQRVD